MHKNLKTTINCEQTFNNFFIDRSNKEAYRKALMYTEKLDDLFNPLFICGGEYLGKTHLLNAIANEYKENHPNGVVAYMTGLDFMENVYLAEKNGTLDVLEKLYINFVDLLIIDEIKHISSGFVAGNAFDRIIKAALNNKVQICLSSTESIDKLQIINEIVRKEGAVNIDVPTEVVSCEIIKKICKEQFENVVFNDEAVRCLAKSISNKETTTLGVIIKLNKYLESNKQIKLVDLKNIQKVLAFQTMS